MQTIFKQELRASMEDIRTNRDMLGVCLKRLCVDKKVAEHFLLAFSEITTNLLKHASPKVLLIKTSLIYKGNELVLSFADDGGSFGEFDSVINSIPNEISIDSMDEGGMGLFLIKQFFEDIQYTPISKSEDGLNHLTIKYQNDNQDKPNILLVEDSRPMLMLIEQCLVDSYKITTAMDAASALEEIEKSSFDLIICDIGLPDKSGLEIRKELKNPTPFIFLTANEDEMVEDAAYDLGVDDYLHKPVDKNQLKHSVKRVLGRSKQLAKSIEQKLDDEVSNQVKPHLPSRIGNLNALLFTREASTGGGDMVMHIPYGARDIIILADVMGHGVEAKYFAHAYEAYFYGLLKTLPKGLGIDQIMSKINELVFNDEKLSGHYITCQIIELDNDIIKICTAGHPKPLVMKNGDISFVETSGILAGVVENAEYEISNIVLGNNGKILFYTDGLTEGDGDTEHMNKFEKDLFNLPKIGINEVWNLYVQCFGGVARDDITYFILEK